MERGSLVIREIAWRVRGSQTPKRSHEETIGDASPSVASSVLSRPSHYPLHSSRSGSVFPFHCCSLLPLLLLHPLRHHHSFLHSVMCRSARVFWTTKTRFICSSFVFHPDLKLSHLDMKQRNHVAAWSWILSVYRKCLVWSLWHSLRWRHNCGCKSWNSWNPSGTSGTP